MLACQNGHDPCARALIEAKANLEAQQNGGWTALMYACQNGHDPCARALIENGANLEAQQNGGWTALMLACQNGHDPCARTLIEAGADIDKGEQKGSTALMFACSNGQELCARALIEAGVDVNAVNSEGLSSLMLACESGHEKCVLTLINKGARLDTVSSSGATALNVAFDSGNKECARVLIQSDYVSRTRCNAARHVQRRWRKWCDRWRQTTKSHLLLTIRDKDTKLQESTECVSVATSATAAALNDRDAAVSKAKQMYESVEAKCGALSNETTRLRRDKARLEKKLQQKLQDSLKETQLLERERDEALEANQSLAITNESMERMNQERTEESLCVVCMDNEATHAFLPCGHRCCCETCAREIQEGGVIGGDQTARCPKCNDHSLGLVRIFV